MPHENDSGSQNPDPQKNDEQKQSEALNNSINSAITAHQKRFTEKVLPGIIGEALKPLTEALSALKAQPAPEPDPKGKDKDKVDPQIAALSAQLEEFKQTAARESQARAAAEKKARDDKAFSDLRSMLTGKIRPEFVDMVTNDLFHIKKVVDVADDGTATFKSTRTQFGVPEEVSYPLQAGVDEWLKSDFAKAVLPAPGTPSNTPATQRRQTVNPSQLPQNFDPDKASPEQRIQHADEMAADMAAKLAARGIRLS